jgi:LytR cell envelope-related transcriptional attenuator
LVLILFIIATAVLLGQIRPGKPAAGSAAAASSSTTTTAPSASTTTTTTTPPGQVAVLSANGSTVAEAATTLATQLHADGWNTLPPVNATSNVATTTVYYAPGFQASADTIAGLLHLTASSVQPITTSVPVSSVAGADVVAVLGPDTAGKTIATTTTTTVPATTTTKAG